MHIDPFANMVGLLSVDRHADSTHSFPLIMLISFVTVNILVPFLYYADHRSLADACPNTLIMYVPSVPPAALERSEP